MQVLHLTLKRCWFDMIHSGIKKEEYREVKPYWSTRLQGKRFDAVRFRNGYGTNAPEVTVSLSGPISVGRGRPEWGAPKGEDVFIIPLGAVMSSKGAIEHG